MIKSNKPPAMIKQSPNSTVSKGVGKSLKYCFNITATVCGSSSSIFGITPVFSAIIT